MTTRARDESLGDCIRPNADDVHAIDADASPVWYPSRRHSPSVRHESRRLVIRGPGRTTDGTERFPALRLTGIRPDALLTAALPDPGSEHPRDEIRLWISTHERLCHPQLEGARPPAAKRNRWTSRSSHATVQNLPPSVGGPCSDRKRVLVHTAHDSAPCRIRPSLSVSPGLPAIALSECIGFWRRCDCNEIR